ncbi:MAG: hypothetical protein CSB34_00090 [Desulfobulbus propionicus]|nr:MAG: hypothetical protein CSB34_00090 [Desulfobulbus propionicus]
MKRAAWNITDLCDLEFFLNQDQELSRTQGAAALVERDRKLYRQELGKNPSTDEQSLVWCWLQLVKDLYTQKHSHRHLPGSIWKELSRYIKWVFFLGGGAAGIAAVLPFLIYTGEKPLNVTGYVGFFVLLQLLLIGVQLMFLGVRRVRKEQNPASILGAIAERLLLIMVEKMRPLLQRKYPTATTHTFAVLKQSFFTPPGDKLLLLWMVFSLMQLAGIGFNCGIIVATLSKVVFTDTAFGWQSTLQIDEQLLASAVSWLAMPWSWLLPEQLSCPDFEAIRGSRIILKDGIQGLTTPNLVSWWPFLCCSVFFYGLLPRAGMLFWGLFMQKRLLGKYPSLNRADIRRLLQRMRTPAVNTSGKKKATKQQEPVVSPPEPAPAKVPPRSTQPAKRSTLLLLPDELQETGCTDQIVARIQRDSQNATIRVSVFGALDTSDTEVLQEIKNVVQQATVTQLIMVQEGWQPPIAETLSWLKEVREAVGQDLVMTILLLGKPKGGNVLVPAESSQLDIWSLKTAALGDTHLYVNSLLS